MVENHTRDLLQMKAKETQLARSRNDAELTQAALSKAQRDLEALRQASHSDSSKEIEMWRLRAEKAEQRILEREELDQSVMDRLTDLEEFIRGLDQESEDSQSIQRISSRCKELEDQNRRLLSQMEEYTSRINTLEDVSSHFVYGLTCRA
jgi:archaellum component FlaC